MTTKGMRKRCNACYLLPKNCNCGNCVYTGGCNSKQGWGTSLMKAGRRNKWA